MLGYLNSSIEKNSRTSETKCKSSQQEDWYIDQTHTKSAYQVIFSEAAFSFLIGNSLKEIS